MEDDREPLFREEPASGNPDASVTPKKRGGLCLLLILSALLAVVCMIGGAIVYAYLGNRKWTKDLQSYTATQSFFLNREKICEMAFVQQTIMVDTRSDFSWNVPVPLSSKEVEVGRAGAKVKGIYLVKYGIDRASLSTWDYYPETGELLINRPQFKVVSIETLFQELDSENESLLKKLQMSERNEAFKRNRDDAAAQAAARIETERLLQDECVEQLRTLLFSFGIKLVLVEPIEPLR